MDIPQKFRLTFKQGNYFRSFTIGFGVVVRDLGEWIPAARLMSILLSIVVCRGEPSLEKMLKIGKYTLFENGYVFKIPKISIFQ